MMVWVVANDLNNSLVMSPMICDEDAKRIILHIVSVRARVSTTPPHAQASMTRKACADKQMSEKEMWNV